MKNVLKDIKLIDSPYKSTKKTVGEPFSIPCKAFTGNGFNTQIVG